MTGTANAPAGHQTETPPGRRSARRRALIAGATGNIVEWFDFTIYGFTAAVLATVFFPPEFGSGALLATFALYGVAFLARPAGGIFFGRLGDRLGRRRSLSLAITLMGCSTAAIGSYRPTLRSVLQHRCCCCSVAWFKDSRPAANTPERQPSSSSMRRLTAEACTRGLSALRRSSAVSWPRSQSCHSAWSALSPLPTGDGVGRSSSEALSPWWDCS